MPIGTNNVEIGGVKFATLDLLIAVVALLVALVFVYYVIKHSDDKTWARLGTVFSGLFGFISGWIGKGAKATPSPAPPNP
jgi:hypothetical protein